MKTYDDIIRKERFDKCIEDMVKRFNLAVDNLTEQQLAQVIGDAIACGDFARLIAPQGQQVVYIPFSDVERLKSKIKHLEKVLDEHGIDPYEGDLE